MRSTPVTAYPGPIRWKPRCDFRHIRLEKSDAFKQSFYVYCEVIAASACSGAVSRRGERLRQAWLSRSSRGKGHSPPAARKDSSGRMSHCGKSISLWQASTAGRDHVALDRFVGRGWGKGSPCPALLPGEVERQG